MSYLNSSYFLARTVRKIHRAQSIALPFLQSGEPSSRDRGKWYDSRSKLPHSTQQVRSLDIKTLSFEETDKMEDISTSLYNESDMIRSHLHLNKESKNNGIIDDKMEIDFDIISRSSYMNSTLPRNNPCGYNNISNYTNKSNIANNHLDNVSKEPNSLNNSCLQNLNFGTPTAFSRGVRAVMSTTSINTVTSVPSSIPNASFFSRSSVNSAKSVPSLLYSLPQKKTELDALPDRDWNREFNDVLESPILERADKLRQLEKEFVEVASKIGKVIISEKNVEQSQKTIKAISYNSGIAGGEKYSFKNIFFKFAVDKNKLYSSDEFAMKVANHELKGHTALVSCGMMHGLKLGLMTVIDYQGSRLTAVSVLPISKSTLVYGSSDGGSVVCSSLKAMNDVMKQCGKVLNLKGHLAGVGDNKKFIYGPCDLEGHLGHDGHLYAIDLARLFPPETPKQSIPGGFLYRLLRPELVKQFYKPLSSDAFTLFGQHDAEIHNEEVKQATNFLHSKIIPNFAKSLSQEDENIPIDDILMKLHRNGINIRYLGEVRSLLTNEEQRKTLLTEIFARVLKNEIRKKLRESKSTLTSSYAQLAVNLFNIIFGSKPVCNVYWNAIKKTMNNRFSDSLNEIEYHPSFDIRKVIHLEQLFYRLQDNIGISFNASINDFPLSLSHFNKFILKNKQMYTVPRIEADTAAELARTTKDIPEAKRLLLHAHENYQLVLELKPDDHIVLSNMGMVLAESALLESDISIRKQLFTNANEKFNASLQLNGNDPPSMIMWSDALINQAILLEQFDDNLIDRAIELSAKAENLSSGIGAVVLARASAIRRNEINTQKWLTHALETGNLPSSDALLHDPAFAEVKNQEWFKALCI